MLRQNSILVAAVSAALIATCGGAVAESINKPEFTEDGAAKIPTGYRLWIFVGAPLTPNALNGGEAAFPEFHNVYIEPSAYEYFKKTGKFAEGTQIVKELVLVRKGTNHDEKTGTSTEASGVGYFQGDFAGLELAYKDNAKYPDEPGGWAYFTFGHKPQPYDQTAKPSPTADCNACHEANAATDYVFTQFYPVLRAVGK